MSENAGRRTSDSFSNLCGLIISQKDDDVAAFEFNLTTLLGLQMIHCHSFIDAERILTSRSVDIVFLDTRLNHVNPFSICKFIKSDKNLWSIAVIALLAKNDVLNRKNALNYGADDYLTLPFDDSELLVRTRAQLRLRELYLKVLQTERLNVLFEMAGAAAHELAQPVTGALGLIDLIRLKSEAGQANDLSTELRMLYECMQRASEVIHKIQRIRRYETTDYAGARKIIDIHKASDEDTSSA